MRPGQHTAQVYLQTNRSSQLFRDSSQEDGLGELLLHNSLEVLQRLV